MKKPVSDFFKKEYPQVVGYRELYKSSAITVYRASDPPSGILGTRCSSSTSMGHFVASMGYLLVEYKKLPSAPLRAPHTPGPQMFMSDFSANIPKELPAAHSNQVVVQEEPIGKRVCTDIIREAAEIAAGKRSVPNRFCLSEGLLLP